MNKTRLEAFSDGVIAILITIMVLELKTPEGATWEALRSLRPVFLAYVLSFVILGIYWNNHHHMFHAVERINGRVLWANAHLLFWLSLVPFGTAWIGEYPRAPLPTAAYATVLLFAGIAYTILVWTLLADGANPRLAKAIGRDLKGRLSLVFYVAAIGLAFWHARIAQGIIVLVASIWLVPDRRIEKKTSREEGERGEG
jgi:TMEM175 potassium channel family protein